MAQRKAREAHPEDELRALSAGVEKALAPAYLLRGEERYFRERGAQAIVRAAQARGHEICKHDALDPEFTLSRLLDDLAAGSLFADARCVVVHAADKLLKKSARAYTPELEKLVKARIAAGDEGTIVLAAESLRADHTAVKAIKAQGGVLVSCRRLWDTPPPWDPDPRRAELVQWVCDRARRAKVSLAPDEAVYVVAATGGDLYELESQIDRLHSRGERGVRELVGWQSGGSPFAVAEHLLVGDAARAVAGLESLFAAGFQGRDGSRTVDRVGLVTILCSALSAKVRESYGGAAAIDDGQDPEGAARAIGVRGGPRAVADFKARVVLRPAIHWQRMVEEVADLERRSRSGALIDVNDFCALALRWRLARKTRAERR